MVCLAGLLLTGCASGGSQLRGAKWGSKPKTFPPPPPVKQVVVDETLRQAARQELLKDAASGDPLARSQSIEALGRVMPQEGRSAIIRALSDSEAQPRKAAVLAVGSRQFAEAHGKLLTMVHDADPNVQVAVRYALHRLGDTRYSHDLEAFARDPRDRVRGDVAMVLGMLHEPSATRILYPMQQDRNAAVRQQVSEALYQLGEKIGLDDLIAGTISGYPDDQMIALAALAERGDRRVAQHIRGALTADYPEVRLVAARALGTLGYDDGYTVAALSINSSDPRQRALAALAFGAIGRADAQSLVGPLLNDANQYVRIAAAMAVLSLKP